MKERENTSRLTTAAAFALLMGMASPAYAARIDQTLNRYSADAISWFNEQQYRITVEAGDTLEGIAKELEQRRVPLHLRVAPMPPRVTADDIYRQNQNTLGKTRALKKGQTLYFSTKDHYKAGYTGHQMIL